MTKEGIQAEAEKFAAQKLIESGFKYKELIPELSILIGNAYSNGVLSDTARKHWEPKLIPVGERLPNDYERVICLTQEGTILNMMYCDDLEEVGCWHCEHNYFKKNSFKNMGVVTHWMPLPTFND